MQKVKRFLNDNKFFPPQSGNVICSNGCKTV